MKNDKKIVVISGTTASGKTKLAVKLARQFNGEIVSADSRQVYKGMDVGTGKDLGDYRLEIQNPKSQITNKSKIQNHKLQINPKFKTQRYKIVNIAHHLIDIVSPNTEFNLAKYQKSAYRAIDDILARGKLPIIAGGTGLYIQAIVDGYELSGGKPDKKSRAKLEKMPVDKLLAMLKKLDIKTAESLNESDRKNKRRLIRRIEIIKSPNKVERPQITPKYEALLIGLTHPMDVLEKRISKRLIERLEKENMATEVKRLHKQGISWKRLEGFGLEYKYVSLYLRGKLSYDEMVEQLRIAIRQFAKRQMNWFRRWEKQGRKIYWVNHNADARQLVKKFLRL